MAELNIYQFPCLSDNFGVLIHDPVNNLTASIDAPETAAVKKALSDKGWQLTHILTTHYHADHTDGNLDLKSEFNCTIVGPNAEGDKVPGIDVRVADGDSYQFGAFEAKVFDTPGHTAGHISYWLPEAEVAFVGDTLFALGCGRLFEGDAQTMWSSLSKLRALPASTQVYCGHEYTLSNAEFALTIEPGNHGAAKQGMRRSVNYGTPTSRRFRLQLDWNVKPIHFCAPKARKFRNGWACRANPMQRYLVKSVSEKTMPDRSHGSCARHY